MEKFASAFYSGYKVRPDVLAFAQDGHAMTGMVYRYETMGALPVGHYRLMNLENLSIQEEVTCNYDSMLHVYPSRGMDYSVLSDEEKAVLDKVITKFKDYKAKEIVDHMHEEKAYKETKAGQIIPFSLARDIRAF